MNSVAQLLSSNRVLLDLDVPNKQALFEVVGLLWEVHRGIVAAEVVDSLNAREKLGSTGLGKGVAIPHARVKGLAEAIAAFVRLKVPIEFNSPDGNPVSDCFVLLVPEQPTERHMQILADIAKMLSKGQFRDQLGASKSRDEIHQLFAASSETRLPAAASNLP
jgi:PTS system nitrogen regulatory IIA component